MVVIAGPAEFVMGSPPTEDGRQPTESQHRKRIGRSYALAAKPVTVREYLRYRQGYEYVKRYAPEEECPVHGTSWYMAAAYCNWLSAQEGIAEDQWCYETDARGQVTKLKEHYLRLTGYRLPTEAEWEYACRAGAVTSRCYGQSEQLLDKYGWYLQNSGERSWPVGKKKPNDWGLLDMHGNVWNWCQERYKPYPEGEGREAIDDIEGIGSINKGEGHVWRGGSFTSQAVDVRSAQRNWPVPTYRYLLIGLRPARTFAAE